jgi:hypothetical protein
MFDRPFCFTFSVLIISLSGPKNPRARKTSWAGKNFSDPGISSIFHLPVLSLVHSTRTKPSIRQRYILEVIKHTCIQAFDIAILVNHEVFSGDTKLPWIVTEMSRDFTVSIICAEYPVGYRCQHLQILVRQCRLTWAIEAMDCPWLSSLVVWEAAQSW